MLARWEIGFVFEIDLSESLMFGKRSELKGERE